MTFEMKLVFGAPIFTTDLRDCLQAPCGQIELYEPLWQKYETGKQVRERLIEEYMAIVEATLRAGQSFHVLNDFKGIINTQVSRDLTARGIKTLAFPDIDHRLQLFPRDIATYINGQLLLEPEYFKHLGRLKDPPLLESYYGQGGRIAHLNGVVVIPEKFSQVEADLWDGGKDAQPEHLQRLGLRVGLVPNMVKIERIRHGTRQLYTIDDHIDRCASLLKGKDGKTYLVVDPTVYTGFRGVYGKPLIKPAKTLRAFQKVADELEIELRVPNEELRVPLSIGIMQFATGQVVMTSGDDELAALVADIVGSENVFTTAIPVECYPARAWAGIRCLFNYLPSTLFQLS